MKFNRNIHELESHAEKWWPKALEKQVAEVSVIPNLVATQEQFISILKISGKTPTQIFDVLAASQMPANLFLKHLVVLADYGGEMIKRLGREFADVFPLDPKTKHHFMQFIMAGKSYRYDFQRLPVSGLGNTKLKIDGAAIVQEVGMDGLYQDMAMILMFGSTSEAAHLAGLEKCEIGALLGDETAISKYVRERYINVSRITTGASANSLGQIAQDYVVEILTQHLPQAYTIERNGKIVLSHYDKDGGMPFDVVVVKGKKKVGVEVTFQVTTNSVIERKAGQAESRQAAMHQDGYWIAYVIDGAGNFQRSSAVSTICRYSDCTIAYSADEIAILAAFIKEKLQ
ncbi:MAG: restriction endonuclease [Gallionella sp.]|nr:MAG: restriction endonuclease [Gallionella sp.]